MLKKWIAIAVITLLWTGMVFAGVTGKIAGKVTDAETGEPLIGANIQIEGTSMGAASSLDGYYVILNVPPGLYSVRASIIGYAEYSVRDVRVEIDMTTTIDFPMGEEVLTGEIVVVTAERKIVKVDVSASQKSITSTQINELPFTTLEDVMSIQAGIQGNMQIRGGSSKESIFMVDGAILRDERNNTPYTSIPLSAMEEVSVQTGGFSPEYNNVRSGVVNVVTKEGSPSHYTGTITMRQSPASAKHFGMSIYDPNSFWLRPYVDEAVAWTGTENGAWNEYTQNQYPKFEGWNAVSEKTLQDDDPSNDLSPAAAQRLFLWQYRKQGDITKPDYNVDAGFGGPVPFLSKSMGNLRFYISHRNEQDMYLLPLSRDGVRDNSTMLKLTSDVGKSMKLTIMGLYGELTAAGSSRSGGTGYMTSPEGIASNMSGTFTVPWRIFTDIYWSPTSRYYNSTSAKFTHMLDPGTFYEVLVKREAKFYRTHPTSTRNTLKVNEIFEGFFVDEAPSGFYPENVQGVLGILGMGGAVSTSRDTTDIITYTARFDLNSQINNHNEIKTGFNFIYDDFIMRFGMKNEFLPEGNTHTSFHRFPYRATAYIQDKIEIEGFVTTFGVNLEYTNPNGDWYETDIYDPYLFSANFNLDSVKTEPAKSRFTLSPRLGVSHPITENSKLYFNYGHYRQIPTSERMYRYQRSPSSSMLDRIGDPTIPLEKTVSYELGYDHALSNTYLVHLAGYYKDITEQEDWTRYISERKKINYYKATNNSYEDIRGFELELTKLAGRWITGNFNYEYRVNTSGEFGIGYVFENPSAQREYEKDNPPNQYKPLPRPRAKSYIDVHTPHDFGPKLFDQNILGAWHMNFIGRWTRGNWFTWNPNRVKGISNNVQWKDYYNVDFKMSKEFPMGKVRLKVFLDIFNLFNTKRFSGYGFYDGAGSHDRDDYYYSLHLPRSVTEKLGYDGIPGDDQPGDYRDYDVDYAPMKWVRDSDKLEDLTPDPLLIYYLNDTQQYMKWDAENENWVEENSKRIDEILDTRAYIDMPNQTFFSFLNPRDIFFGMNLSFSF